MKNIDVVEKIAFQRIVKSLVSKTVLPHEVLQQENIIRGRWNFSYFNWGRNGLYALFKSLPYRTIHFPAFTCSVLTDAALAAGKKVILVEVDLQTYNLDFDKLPKKEPECLVVVHTFGNPVKISELRKIFPHTFLIEDCAHALFALINHNFVGNLGDAVLFSLYKQIPNINGALLLAHKKISLEQKEESVLNYWPRIFFKTEGRHHFFINFLRHRYIDTLEKKQLNDEAEPSSLVKNLFSLGLPQLKKTVKKRQKIAGWYQELFKNSRYFRYQKITDDCEHSYYQFVIYLQPKHQKWRDQIVFSLRKQNIFLDRLWYSAPIKEKGFEKFKKTCPNSLFLANSVISLPTSPKLRKENLKWLVDRLNQEIEKCR